MADAGEEKVRGTEQFMKQAEAGMKLFAGEGEAAELDPEAAQKFKDEADAKAKALDDEAAALTGKDNKKARTEKSKEASAVKTTKEYIDALKVLKGIEPPNGNFVKKAAVKSEAPAAAAAKEAEAKDDKKDDKKKKEIKTQAAGISKAERDELEGLKTKIIDKKKELKESGMSGGQINKDEAIVEMVKRMNELKEKENPGCLQAKKADKKESKGKKLDSATVALLEEKKKAMEEYLEKLRTEFKYSKKEIAADPDYIDMKAEVDKLEKGK